MSNLSQTYKSPCMICGGDSPGHVIVKGRHWAPDLTEAGELRPVGQVCSAHTLAEVILHPSDHLTLEVLYGEGVFDV